MVNIMKFKLGRESLFGARSVAQVQRKELLERINELRESIGIAQNYFENQTDPDLIESAIFELKSLKTQYSYLIKQAKSFEGKKLA